MNIGFCHWLFQGGRTIGTLSCTTGRNRSYFTWLHLVKYVGVKIYPSSEQISSISLTNLVKIPRFQDFDSVVLLPWFFHLYSEELFCFLLWTLQTERLEKQTPADSYHSWYTDQRIICLINEVGGVNPSLAAVSECSNYWYPWTRDKKIFLLWCHELPVRDIAQSIDNPLSLSVPCNV